MESLKSFRPVTASLRNTILLDRGVDDVQPFKALTVGKKSTGGRDGYGHITSRRRGGGAKRKYRIISFKKTKFDNNAVIQSIEYDPNRSANIALLKYEDGSHEYSIAISGMVAGDTVITSAKADVLPGNTLPLSVIPIGTVVSSVELVPGGGSKIARAAGTSVVVVGKEDGMVMLKMPSNEIRKVPDGCLATIGITSNMLRKNVKIGKAGRNRHLGIRPSVRGVAMNPVDHPLGGGEGKTSGGRHPVSPWGKSAKGKKTRNNKRTDSFIVTDRRKRKK